MFVPALFDRAVGRLERRGLAHTFVGVTGRHPARPRRAQSLVPCPDGAVSMADVDPALFRQLLGRFATGVTVLTTRDKEGQAGRHDRLEPRVGVAHPAARLGLRGLSPPTCTGRSRRQRHLRDQRPGRGTRRRCPAASPSSRPRSGSPGSPGGRAVRAWCCSEGALAHIECERFADFPLGDHTLFVGRVTGGTVGDGEPLLYYRGGYGGFADDRCLPAHAPSATSCWTIRTPIPPRCGIRCTTSPAPTAGSAAGGRCVAG